MMNGVSAAALVAMENTMNRPVHFEIHAPEPEPVQAF